ncbi:MAG: hypothetical protein HXX19_00220, partial [Rhodoferax sp.]|nr:hypothetical protein [Rhodoferax sp.]
MASADEPFCSIYMTDLWQFKVQGRLQALLGQLFGLALKAEEHQTIEKAMDGTPVSG